MRTQLLLFVSLIVYLKLPPPQKKKKNPTQPTAIIAEEEVNVTLLRNRYLKLLHLQYLIQ